MVYREYGGKKGDILELGVHTDKDGLVQSGDTIKLFLTLDGKLQVKSLYLPVFFFCKC